MYVVRAEGLHRWSVIHPTLGAFPLSFTSERMAAHLAWALNMAPDSLEGLPDAIAQTSPDRDGGGRGCDVPVGSER